uniref:Zinc finger, CCHC-type n=1 Tax=Caenorhabditis tropicalis TaxID=1561998 RepID=A0A1I7TGN5_9PELO
MDVKKEMFAFDLFKLVREKQMDKYLDCKIRSRQMPYLWAFQTSVLLMRLERKMEEERRRKRKSTTDGGPEPKKRKMREEGLVVKTSKDEMESDDHMEGGLKNRDVSMEEGFSGSGL